MDKDSNTIIMQWLDDLAFSAATCDLEAHMALVSKQVTVVGIPGIGSIDYEGWRSRRGNEFRKRLLHSLHYRRPRLLSAQPQRITFSVHELMKGRDQRSLEVEKEVTLHQEQDGQWRVIREQILTINAKGAGAHG